MPRLFNAFFWVCRLTKTNKALADVAGFADYSTGRICVSISFSVVNTFCARIKRRKLVRWDWSSRFGRVFINTFLVEYTKRKFKYKYSRRAGRLEGIYIYIVCLCLFKCWFHRILFVCFGPCPFLASYVNLINSI